MILLDSNVVVYAHAAHSPFFEAAKRLRDQVIHGELEACVSPQVLCEFIATCTNPKLFQPALTAAQAAKEVTAYWAHPNLRKILPRDRTVERMVGLMERYRLTGQRIYDAFLVATMLDNDVRAIYTLNTKDFERYPEIRVVNPFSQSSLSS